MEALHQLAATVPCPDVTNARRRLLYHNSALQFCTDGGALMRAPYPRFLVRPGSIYHYKWLKRPVHDIAALDEHIVIRGEDGSVHVMEHSHDGVIKKITLKLSAPIVAIRSAGLLLSAIGDVYQCDNKWSVRRITLGRPILIGTRYYGVTADGTLLMTGQGEIKTVHLPHPVREIHARGRSLFALLTDGQWHRVTTAHRVDLATSRYGALSPHRVYQAGKLVCDGDILPTDGFVYDAVRVHEHAQTMYFFAFVLSPTTGEELLSYLEYARHEGVIGRYLRHAVETGEAR